MLEIQRLPSSSTTPRWTAIRTFGPPDMVVVAAAPTEETGSAALSQLGSSFSGERIKNVVQEFKDTLSLVVFSRAREHAYIAVIGEGEVEIERAQTRGVLVSGERASMRVITGVIRPGDVFVLRTPSVALSVRIPAVSDKVVRERLGEKFKRVVRRVLSEAGIIRTGVSIFLKKLRQRDIYLHETKPRKGTLIVGILFLLILVTGIVWGFAKNAQKIRIKAYEERVAEVQHNLEESRELADLNPPRARELARKAAAQLSQLISEGVKDERVTLLAEEVERVVPDILGEYHVEPRLLVDLGLVREGFTTHDVYASEDQVVVLDKEHRILLSFTIEGGDMRVLAGPDTIPQGRLVALWDGRPYTLDGQRVALVEKEGEARTVILPEGTWGRVSHMAAFGGNIYLLDAGRNEIWRYSGLVSRFGQGEAYFREGVDAALGDVVRMAIDGSVWLLREDGRIAKYTRGRLDGFRIEGVENAFNHPQSITTDSRFSNVYVLDNGNSRVVVLDKSGVFKAQYVWETIKDATGIAVSEEKKKLLIFVGGKVYEVELKN
ncbi:hypothetical protein HYV21_01015 [Candidatus Microgenomates bacterium]|nr:hypothetical protein [Candidatus Microgenomates bacterium]